MPAELISTPSPPRGSTAARLAAARRCLKRESAKGRVEHWSYDVSRHLALKDLVRDLEAALAREVA